MPLYTNDDWKRLNAEEIRREAMCLAALSDLMRAEISGLNTYVRMAQLRPRQVLTGLLPGERNWPNRDGNWMRRAFR